MRKSFGIDVVLKIAFVQHDDVMCKDFFRNNSVILLTELRKIIS